MFKRIRLSYLVQVAIYLLAILVIFYR